MPKRTVFSEDERKLILGAVSRVWDEVAYDCLQATAEDKGKSVDEVTISRSQVIEIALDASRPEDILRRSPLWTNDLKARWEGLTYRQRINFVKPAFPYERYGT